VSEPVATTRALTCPACGAPIELRAAGYTTTVACSHCGSILDALDPELKLIAHAQQALRAPRIALGTRGTLADVTWEVVGYLERTDDDEPWSEYLLFNPYYGYRFLVDAGDRWTLGRLLDGPPATRGGAVRVVDGLMFRQDDDAYEVRVTVALGEFYWRVAAGDTVQATDYSGPGAKLSQEQAEDEETWTRLDTLPAGAVESAFGLAAPKQFAGAPSPTPAAPAGPKQKKPHCTLARLALIGWLVIMVIHPSSVALKNAQIDTALDGQERTVALGSIDLPKAHNRVSINTQASGLDNAWIDVDARLVDQKTQQSYEGYALAEHYTGRDSDGPWSEGDSHGVLQFSSVPAGRYDLVLDVSGHRWEGAQSSPPSWSQSSDSSAAHPQLMVSVNRGGLPGTNVFLAFLAIVLPAMAISYSNFRANLRERGVIK